MTKNWTGFSPKWTSTVAGGNFRSVLERDLCIVADTLFVGATGHRSNGSTSELSQYWYACPPSRLRPLPAPNPRSIDVDEFSIMMAKRLRMKDSEEEFIEAFKVSRSESPIAAALNPQ